MVLTDIINREVTSKDLRARGDCESKTSQHRGTEGDQELRILVYFFEILMNFSVSLAAEFRLAILSGLLL